MTEPRQGEVFGAATPASGLDHGPLFDLVNDGILVQDADTGAILDANRRAEQMFGLTRDELRASDFEHLSEGLPPYTQRDAMEIVRRAAHGPPQLFEWRARRSSGELFWVEVNLSRVRLSGADRLLAVVRDVSERKRAEAALHELEDRARQRTEELRQQEAFATRILASSLNGIYVVDVAAGQHVFVNARYTQLTGYTLEDLRAHAGELVATLFHPDDCARVQAHLAALARADDGEVLDIEYRFRVRDGRWISCFSRETPFSRTPDGRVRELIGTFVDVTELRHAQESARESEALYRSLFEAMTEGFALLEVICHPDGRATDARILEVNPAFERATGISREKVVGRLLGEVAPRESAYWLETYGAVALSGAPAHVELRSTVGARDFEVYAFAPRPRQLALLLVDVTGRKRIEQELRDADRRKNEFLGVLSHELRNPLAPIRNAIYLLAHAPADSEQAARARHVLGRQTEHLTRLVDDLLDVTRISRGKIALRRARVDARELVLRTCEDHRSVFEQSGVELRTELPADAVWIEADPMRLGQVVGNILQNAVKFTPVGGRVVVAAAPAAGRLELRVRDTGVGIEPDHVERMFQPFEQADRTLARSAGGLGLGLALVKGLVELHGGTVTARSEGLGRGTEVVVTLPLASSESAPSTSPIEATLGPPP
jgi:PAS domain S-box-containing protein